MIPSHAYRRQQQPIGWTRIDLLLALYDGAIERLDQALEALRRGDESTARPLLGRVQCIVTEMAAGVNPEVGDSSSANLLILYEFFAHSLAEGKLPALESVRRSMNTLREGFRAIRDEAVQLERTGAIPSNEGQRLITVEA